MRGFSLVELSIVLVILGLLTGGILAGQSLIRAAELRSISTQQAQIVTAVQSFRDKYMALPGDMRKATDFWLTAANCPGTPTQGSTDKTTCNGDGDGRIHGTLGAGYGNESYRFWQHLANAGLIEGQYSGVTGTTSNVHSSIAANSMTGKIASTGWFVWNWLAPNAGDANWFAGEYGNRLSFGGFGLAGEPATGIVSPEEVWNIDTKLDDGKPGAGKILVGMRTACTDSASATDFNSNYLLTEKARLCFLMMRNAF